MLKSIVYVYNCTEQGLLQRCHCCHCVSSQTRFSSLVCAPTHQASCQNRTCHHVQVIRGLGTMLDTPASAFVSITISQPTQTRRLLASSTSHATAATSQVVTAIIQPPVASNSSVPMASAASSLTAPTVARLLSSSQPIQSQSALGLAVMQVTQSYRIGTCGNGICEVGERGIKGNGSQAALLEGSCPGDCPVQYTACPSNQSSVCSSRGSCMSSQGVCSCFMGYTL